MAYPTLYTVDYSYTAFQQAQGNNDFPGTQLDNDLAGLEASIGSLDEFMKKVQRADGALSNGIVTFDSLSADVKARFGDIESLGGNLQPLSVLTGTGIMRRTGDYSFTTGGVVTIAEGGTGASTIDGFKLAFALPDFDTKAAVQAATIPAPMQYIRTAGYDTPGDGGACYKRFGSSPPSHAMWIKSANNVYFEIAEAVISVRMAGAKGDSATDDTAAFRNALSVGRAVYIPCAVGKYLLTDMLTISTPGQKIFGDSYFSSQIRVESSFNMAADGVFKITTGEPGPRFLDFGIWFDQPDVITGRPNLINYPPAFYGRSQPRVEIRNVAVIKCMTGFDLRGNCGGLYLDNVHLAPFSVAGLIDGSLDTIRALNVHVFPLYFTGTQLPIFLAPNPTGIPQTTVGTAGVVGFQVGRADDLIISNCLFICGMQLAVLTGNGGPGGTSWDQGNATITISGTAFDSHSGIVMNQPAFGGFPPGEVNVGGASRFSLASNAYAWIALNAGNISVSGCTLYGGVGGANPQMAQVGGRLTISGCRFNTLAGDVTTYLGNTSGDVIFTGNTFHRTANIAYTQSTLHIGAGMRATIVSNRISDKGTGAGAFIQVDADDMHVVLGNPPVGWSNVFPTAVFGLYAFNGTPLSVHDGGTGLSAGTSGGVPFFSSASTIASSAALTANAPVIGGGAGAAPSTVAAGTDGQVFAGKSGLAPAFVTLSGDGSMSNTGVLTVTKTNGVAFGTAATKNTGTSGAVIPLLNAANTFSANQVINGGNLGIGSGAGTPANAVDVVDAIAGALQMRVNNTSTSSSALAALVLQTTAGSASFQAYSAAQGGNFNWTWAGAGATQFIAQNATGSFFWHTGAAPTVKMALSNAGGLNVGGAADAGAGNIKLSGSLLLGSFTVATLPAGVAAGQTAYASNCRMFNGAGAQEGAGAGTGGLVSYNGTAWKIAGTNVTAVA